MTPLIALLLIESDTAQTDAVTQVVARDQPEWRLVVTPTVALGARALVDDVFDVVLVRYQLADGNAFDLLPTLKDKAVLLLVNAGQAWEAAQGMRHGFGDYVVTDDPASLAGTLARQALAVHDRFVAARRMREDQHRFDLANHGYVLVPWDRNVITGTTDTSDRLDVMLGYNLGENQWNQTLWRELIHPDDRARVQSTSEAYLSGKSSTYECEYRMRRKDGAWVWVLSRGRIVERDAHGLPVRLVGAFMDITTIRQTQDASQRQNLLLHAISRAQAAFIASTRNTSVFEGVLADVLAATGSEYGFVGEVLYDPQAQPYIRIHALTDISWDEASRKFMAQSADGGIEFRNTRTLFGAALLTGKPVIANDPGNDERRGGRPPGHAPMDSFLGIPIHYDGAMVAMVALANGPDGYSQADVDFLEPLCHTIGQLVQARRNDMARFEAVQALHKTTEQLAIKTSALETTLDSMDQGIATVEADGRIGVYNRRCLELLDLSEPYLTERPTMEAIVRFQNERGDFGKGWDLVDEQGRDYLAQGGINMETPTKYIRQTQAGRMIEVATRAIATGGFVRTFADVTAEHKAKQALQERLEFIEKITRSAPGLVAQMRVRPDGVWSFPYASAAFVEIFGIDPKTVVDDAARLVALIHPDDRSAVISSLTVCGQNLAAWQYEYRLRYADGSIRWLYADTVPEREPDGAILWCGFITDITARKNSEQRIERLAFFDDLTGLPNRRLLINRLQAARLASGRTKQGGALLFIDLDNFKDLNDTQGHDVGDQLLQHVALRLGQCVRGVDTVARLGGDEFVVMLEELSAEPNEAAAQADRVGRKIIAVLNQPYQFNGLEHHSTPSIGVAVFHDQQHGVEELLKRADLAMYQAKAAGRNALCFYEPAMQAVVTQRAELEAELRHGLQRDEMLVYYQPVVDVAGQMTGVEALARWAHPRRGLVSPGEFIPLAERTGLILPLGQWVLETVCNQLVAWSAQPATRGLSIAVNVSARQFRHPEFVQQVRSLLASTQANPSLLKLELTESMLLNDVEDVIGKMSELKRIGVSFSLDDFGTGYSSLSYLKRLPLDQLKIDQSFVRDVLTDPNDAAIARTILNLAQSLDLAVVAEGVETAEQRDFLVRSGCKAFQGYLFGRPMPVAALSL